MSITHFALLLLMCLPSLRQNPAAQSQTSSETQRTATISGRIILNGEPLGGVRIQFLPKRGSVRTGREEPLRAVADGQGRYQITGISAGIYRVDILSDEFLLTGGAGYIKRRQFISVLEGENVYRLNKSDSGNTRQAFVDARGQFAFSNLAPGEYEIRLGLSVLPPGKPSDNAISKLILKTRQRISIGGDESGSGTGDATVTLSIDLSQKGAN